MIEEPKKKGNGLVIVVIILLLICLGLGGFIYLNKDKIFTKQEQETTKKEDSNTKEECPEISYDIKTTEYGFGDSSGGIGVLVDSSRKKAVISYNDTMLVKAHGVDIKASGDEYSYTKIDEKTFEKKIVQVLIGGFGQDATYNSILYLMEDGTLEYTPITKDLDTYFKQEDNTKKFNSYGKLEGVKDIVYMMNVLFSAGGGTVVGRKADGTLVDLSEPLKATGNFDLF